MNNILVSLLFCIFLTSLISCNEHADFLGQTDSFKMPKEENKMIAGYINSFDKEYIVTFGRSDSIIEFKNLTNNQVEKQVYIGEFLRLEDEKEPFYHITVVNFDSIFFKHKNKLFLIDSKSELQNFWDIDSCLSVFDIQLNISSNMPLVYLNNCVYFSLVGKKMVNSPKNRRDYFAKVPPVGYINIQNDSVGFLPIKFPEVYRNGNNYLDFVPYLNKVNNDLVVSYGLTDSLYFYNTRERKLGGWICQSKKARTPVNFPDDSSSNYVFRRKYDFEQLRYQSVFIDHDTKRLLRFVSLPTKLLKTGGYEIKKIKNWSVIVFDIDQKKQIGEQFFNSDKWAPYIIETGNSFLLWKIVKQDADSLLIAEFKFQDYG